MCIYLIKLHFFPVFEEHFQRPRGLSTYLDLEPGVLRAETDVAGGDQVDACQRDDAPSQHHDAFPLRSCGATIQTRSKIMTHLPRYRLRGWLPPLALDTGGGTWWEIGENDRESTQSLHFTLNVVVAVWHFYMLIHLSIIFTVYLVISDVHGSSVWLSLCVLTVPLSPTSCF